LLAQLVGERLGKALELRLAPTCAAGNEFVNFPYGRFDDQVDSSVQLIHSEKRLATCGGRVKVIY